MLKEHQRKHKNQTRINCDHCGLALESIADLDQHLNSYHNIRPKHPNSTIKNDVVTNSLQRNVPTNHTMTNNFSVNDKVNNGPSFNWKEGRCRFGDTCKYAHIDICRFQDKCRASNSCNFYHFSKNNTSFLVNQVLSNSHKSFQLNHKEFPPLQRSRTFVPRRR